MPKCAHCGKVFSDKATAWLNNIGGTHLFCEGECYGHGLRKKGIRPVAINPEEYEDGQPAFNEEGEPFLTGQSTDFHTVLNVNAQAVWECQSCKTHFRDFGEFDEFKYLFCPHCGLKIRSFYLSHHSGYRVVNDRRYHKHAMLLIDFLKESGILERILVLGKYSSMTDLLIELMSLEDGEDLDLGIICVEYKKIRSRPSGQDHYM